MERNRHGSLYQQPFSTISLMMPLAETLYEGQGGILVSLSSSLTMEVQDEQLTHLKHSKVDIPFGPGTIFEIRQKAGEIVAVPGSMIHAVNRYSKLPSGCKNANARRCFAYWELQIQRYGPGSSRETKVEQWPVAKQEGVLSKYLVGNRWITDYDQFASWMQRRAPSITDFILKDVTELDQIDILQHPGDAELGLTEIELAKAYLEQQKKRETDEH